MNMTEITPSEPGWYWFEDADYGLAPVYLDWVGFRNIKESRTLEIDMCVGEDQSLVGMTVGELDGKWCSMDMVTIDGAEEIVRTISSPRYGWHCTTKKKMERYKISGRIIAPVRFWPTKETAERWAKRTGRLVIKIRLDSISYPLPDHKQALFCPQDVTCFDRA